MMKRFMRQLDPNSNGSVHVHVQRSWVGMTNAGTPGVPLDCASNPQLALHEATAAVLLTPEPDRRMLHGVDPLAMGLM